LSLPSHPDRRPTFGRRQELPEVEERFLFQLPGRVAALLDILDRTPIADRPTDLAAAQIPKSTSACSTRPRRTSAIVVSLTPRRCAIASKRLSPRRVQ
jgi:hypothetical protein